MLDHASHVLGACIPGRRDLLLTALTALEPDHFRDSTYRNIFILLDRYYNLTGEIITGAALEDLLNRQGIDAGKVLLYTETYAALERQTVADHEFRYAIDGLKDLRALQLTGEAITGSMEILERGMEVDRRTYKGHEDARDYLYSQLAIIDRLSGVANQSPEGDIRLDRKDILTEYADRKSGKTSGGIFTGLPAIDNTTFGLQKGELDIVAAYTSAGKTTLCAQIAWHACTQGHNVFFATSETIRAQVRRKIIARHSRLPQFNCPDGLNSAAIKRAALTDDEEQIFQTVVDDWTNNPYYGKLHLVQVPRGATLGLVESRLQRAFQNWHVDLCVIDYLPLLRSDRPRQKTQEELNDVVKDAKVMAVTVDDGNGVPVLSPWQMSQKWYTEAMRTGEYTLANLAETAEVEKSADIILSLLALPDTPGEVKMQFLKNRDGSKPPPQQLEVNFESGYMGMKSVTDSVSSLLDDME